MAARGLPGRLVRWRLVSAIVIVVSLFAGLPWGPLGVAAAYSLSGFLIRTPLFVWYAASQFGIAPRRLLASVGVPLASGSLVAAVLVLLRAGGWLSIAPMRALVLCAAIAAGLHLGVLLVLPYSRQRLHSAIALLRHGFKPAAATV
jgi:PST family polysaccharide transporter